MPLSIFTFLAHILAYCTYFLPAIPHQKFGLEQKGTNVEEAEDNEDYNESIVEEDNVIRSSINDPFEE